MDEIGAVVNCSMGEAGNLGGVPATMPQTQLAEGEGELEIDFKVLEE